MQDELPAAIERLQADAKEPRRADQGPAVRLARSRSGRARRRRARTVVVVAALDGWDQNGAEDHRLGHRRDGPGTSPRCSAARRPSPSSSRAARIAATDCGAVLKQLAARFGGKGGGRPELAQGGGLQGDAARRSRTTCARCSEASRARRRLHARRPRCGRPPLSGAPDAPTGGLPGEKDPSAAAAACAPPAPRP